jgi:hypothetical protein
MPAALTRRRSPDAPAECWQIYYDDVRVGTIARHSEIPRGQPSWRWSCGFYPGSGPGDCTHGTAATFELARVAFEAAWRVFLSKRTEADFHEWRDQQALIEGSMRGSTGVSGCRRKSLARS